MQSRYKKPDVVNYNTVFKKLLVFTILLLVIIFSLRQVYKFDYKKPIMDNLNLISSDEYLRKITTKLSINDIEDEIRAESYLIYDLNNDKVLLGKAEKDIYPIASITKLMTAYVALSDCADEVKVYLDSLLIASDNEASEKIAEICPNRIDFLEKMNYYAKKNKLSITFTNPSGLDYEENNNEVSNWGNAVSIAKLINILNQKNSSLLYHTTLLEYNNIQNTNKLISQIPFIIGSKTGYTDSAGGNLVTLYDIGTMHKIAIIVLNSTREDRFTDTFNLLNFYLKSL